MSPSLPQPDQPNPPPPGAPLGDKILYTLESLVYRAYNMLIAPISARLRRGIDQAGEELEQFYQPILLPLADDILANPNMPEWVHNIANEIKNPSSQWAAILGSILGAVALPPLVGGGLQPVSNVVGQWVNQKIRSTLPDPNLILAMLWREDSLEPLAREWMEKHGLPDDVINRIESALRPRPAIPDLVESYYRGQTSLTDIKVELAGRGYVKADVDRYVSLLERIPPPPDLVRFALREVWDDDVVRDWGYGADWKDEFGEYMTKIGYSDEWARDYWYAHWQLPSISLGMEMLHRRIMTPTQFETLLRLQDIPLGWRNMIQQVSYNPLTRVDVRRMYQLGVLGEEEVYSSYLDLGYDSTNAQRMTDFTIRYATETEREASRSDIERGYKLGMLSQEEAIAWLQSIGYPNELASFYIRRLQAEAEADRVDLRVTLIHKQYLEQLISESEARGLLTGLGMYSGEVDIRIETWALEQQTRVERPSRATLERFFIDDIITEEDFTSQLSILGYDQTYISWYLLNATAEKQEKALLEEERARDEREETERRELATQYQRDKAQLDLDVAEVKGAIADTQLAIQVRGIRYNQDLDLAQDKERLEEVRQSHEQRILVLRSDVAALRSQVADSQETVASERLEIALLKETDPAKVAKLSEETAKYRLAELAGEEEEVSEKTGELAIEIADLRLAKTLLPMEFTKEDVTGTIANLQAEQKALPQERDAIALEIKSLESIRDKLSYPATRPDIDSMVAARVLQGEGLELERHEILSQQLEVKLGLLNLETAELRDSIAKQVAQHETAIKRQEETQSQLNADIREKETNMAQERVDLQTTLDLAERAADIATVEREYLSDVEQLALRLQTLRDNYSQLVEAKALLTFDYRSALVED